MTNLKLDTFDKVLSVAAIIGTYKSETPLIFIVPYYCYSMYLLITCFTYTYHIALNFWESKFSWMVVFEDSVNTNLMSKLCAHHTRNVVWAWHTSKFYALSHRCLCSSLNLSAKQCLLHSLASVPCGFGHILSIDAFARENWSLHVKSFHWNNFVNGGKFAKFTKLKTHESLALYSMSAV